MRNVENQAIYNKQRNLYMEHKMTHEEFYLWLADFIGINESYLPVSLDRIRKSTDAHLNDIPLHLWDAKDCTVRPRAYSKGLAWSLSDTVCTLKAIARKAIST